MDENNVDEYNGHVRDTTVEDTGDKKAVGFFTGSYHDGALITNSRVMQGDMTSCTVWYGI